MFYFFFILSQVQEEYEKNGFEFLMKVFNTPGYLEDLTGLTQLHLESETAEVGLF